MILHDNLSSGNGYKVRLLLAQLGLPFDRIEYDIDRGETRTPEFLDGIDPNGRIPVLETDNGEFLAESDAILFFLAEGTPFLPDGRLERARVLRWMFFEQYSHEPNVATPRYWATHGIEMTEERRLALQTKRKLGHDALGVMEGHLCQNDYFVGGRYSVADIALYAYTHVTHEGGFDLTGYPAVRAWIGRVAARPGYVPITRG
ncbi:MAG: glutathione S-transferase family protein [Actinomycetota bacterium]|nr:glutathione S-transferase family protein [Actinomycetota bacterium]